MLIASQALGQYNTSCELANSSPFEWPKKFCVRVMNNRKNIFKEACKHPLLQLGWLLEPASPPEHMVQFVLARRKHKRLVWRVCKVEEASRKFYTYLFVLTIRVHGYLHEHENTSEYKMKLDDPTDDPIVRYFYNMMGKSKDDYRNIDPFVRQKIQEIFKRSTKEGVHLSLVDKYDASIFAFGYVSKSPAIVTDGPHPKEIEYDEIDFEKIAIDDECLGGLTDHIYSSAFWTDLTRITKGRRRRKRTSPAHEDLWYLRRAEDVLEMYDTAMSSENARWFRKTGPTAVDFVEKTVHRRRELSRLKAQVAEKPVSLLVGPAASGKTVLALNLAYELCKAGKTYYFDCDKVRGLDDSRLLSDLRTIKGTAIIENIHLIPQESQSIYSAFKHDKDRHILFTSRPSLADGQYSRSEDLTEAETLSLESTNAVDSLIKAFCAWHKIDLVSHETMAAMKEITCEDLWLLAYVLTGYANASGQGDPKQWLGAGVLRDLQDLENTNALFPEVLVTISALYRHELLMAEAHLIDNLGFTVEVLNNLSRRGEIVRHGGPDGEILYGLPHTALAHAYWECGTMYKRRRKLTDYESIIHGYVSSGFSNGLRVLAAVEETVREHVAARLEERDNLPAIISNEQSTGAIDSWLRTAHTVTIARDEVLIALARKMEEHDYAMYIPELLKKLHLRGGRIWKRFCAKLDCERLVDRMAKTGGLVWVGITVYEMARYDKAMMQTLYSFVKFEELVQELNQLEDSWTIGRCVSGICRIDSDAHTKFARALNWQKLADLLCNPGHLWSAEQCLQEIMCANRSAARKLCAKMSVDRLVKALDSSLEILENKGCILSTIYRANPQKGKQLWRAYKNRLAREMRSVKEPSKVARSLGAIAAVDPKMARELLSLLDINKMATLLSETKDLPERVRIAGWLICLEKNKGQAFWREYKNKLAEALSDSRAILSVAPCVRELYSVGKHKAEEFCGALNTEKLAENLNSVYFWYVVDDIMSAILDANKGKGQELWESVFSKEPLLFAGGLFFDIWAALWHIQDIRAIDSPIAEQLCAQSDLEELADRLSRSGWEFAEEIAEWVCTVYNLVPRRRDRFWQRLDKKQIACSFSTTGDLKAVTSCIEQIDSLPNNWSEELCQQLDLPQLAFTLRNADDTESCEKFLTVLAKVHPDVHKQLLKLLGEQ
jgi:hypothetical protein